MSRAYCGFYSHSPWQTEHGLKSFVITQELTAEDRTPADILAAIAALPMAAGGKEFSGRDHDKILYGDKGAR